MGQSFGTTKDTDLKERKSQSAQTTLTINENFLRTAEG